MGDKSQSLAEVKVDYIQCSPLVNSSHHAITEGYYIVQAWFLFGEFMQTTPRDILFFYMLGDDLQKDLFHYLSKSGG